MEAVSKSRFWPHTAIFVLEDDAQNGPDHVDSHRSPSYVISPYTRRGGMVDSSFYNTTSMLRTMEALLKLPPLTPDDASSPLIIRPFAAKPDFRPYEAGAAGVPLDTLNPPGSESAARSAALDLTAPDRIDDAEMNAIPWQALRGNEPMPPSTRAAFRRSPAR